MILGLLLMFLYLYSDNRMLQAEEVSFSAVFWCLYLFAVTELLSAFHGLTAIGLWTAWILFDGIMVLLLLNHHRYRTMLVFFHGWWKSKNLIGKAAVIVFIGLSAATMTISSHVVPYNWDSLTYHLTRIYYWYQYHSIAHFASTGFRQVASPVLAEFINTNAYIMYHSAFQANDGLFNLLQTASYLINILLVYSIANQIGCRKEFSLLAAFLFACAPICFAEGMSTQVDEFATIWLLLFISIVLNIIHDSNRLVLDRQGILRLCALGVSAGFGYLAKPSVVIGMVIFTIWLLSACLRRHDSPALIVRWAILTSLIAVAVISPEVIRNLVTFHAISHKQVGGQQLVATLDPRYLLINFLKNLTFNLPSIYWPWLNGILHQIVYGSAALLGVNADALSISESGSPIKYHTVPDFGFDTAINPMIVSLMIFVCICYLIRRARHRGHGTSWASYSKMSVICFLVICILIRWEEFVTRYMISYLAVLCPMISLELQKINNGKLLRVFRNVILCVICLLGLRDLYDELYYYYSQDYFGNDASLHDQRYFVQNFVYDNYAEIKEIVQQNGYQKIGMNISDGAFEYPLLKMLSEDRDLHFEHVNVDNMTGRYEDQSFEPDCIIIIADDTLTGTSYKCHGIEYTKVFQVSEKYQVFAR